MNLIFKDPKIYQRMHEGPLGQYIDSYAAEMCEQGYCEAAAESQIRLVTDFSRWMVEQKITPQQITTDRCKIYLRFRAQVSCQWPCVGRQAAFLVFSCDLGFMLAFPC
jgi:hypothetical protein